MRLKIAVLAGDGIGPEVTHQATNILRAVAELGGHEFIFVPGLIGGIAITETGSPLPTATLDAALECDAVLLGAVGDNKFNALPPDKRPEAGLLQIRMAELQGIIVHHERAEGRHHLDDARRPGGVQLLRQRKDECAQVRIDAVAEFDNEGRVTGGEKAGLWGRWHVRQHLASDRADLRRCRRAASLYGLPIDSTNCAVRQRGA